MKKTFWQFSQQILSEESPMGGPGGMSGGPPMGGPGDMGGGPPMGGPGGMSGGMPPIGGPGGMSGGMPPMGGLGGDMGGPPMGGSPMGSGNEAPKQIELAPLDVWEVLNKILDGKEIKTEKEKKPVQPPANPVSSNNVPPQGENPPINM